MSELEELISKLPDVKDGLNWHLSKTLKGKYRVYYGSEFVEADTLVNAIQLELAPKAQSKSNNKDDV